ncbi:MAG TPA: PIN domain-containing protein [Rickettsia endosymbiont of Sericostoma sp.]|nr:PIN domain-containing protein [Rickettsia endosymbiont of Sericostoma sp. HW-2014]HJD63530.1 PIN domain-containing protein [Rickettsia endosymbiont of Sericostoma sp.]
MKYICDSNFILRYLIADNPEMFSKTKEIFEQVKTGHITLIIEQTVFTEVIFVLSSFYKVPRDKITLTLSEMLTYKGIQSDKNYFLLALDYYLKYNLHIVDCILLAKAVTTDLPILSFDQKLLSLANKQLKKE